MVWNGNGWEDCKYLVRYMDGKRPTRCLIYQHRLYALTGKNQMCVRRDNSKYNFPDCPFNKENQETHPKFK